MVSFRTTPNMKQKITSHNTNILKRVKQKQNLPMKKIKTCNCRTKKDCHMDGQCLKECTVYQATVTETKTDQSKTYIGLTGNSFKTDTVITKNHSLMKDTNLTQS